MSYVEDLEIIRKKFKQMTPEKQKEFLDIAQAMVRGKGNEDRKTNKES